MIRIVRLLSVIWGGFCLTIPSVYAEETQQQSLTLPALVIDLTSVAIDVYRQFGQVWLGLVLAGVVLAVLGYMALNRRAKAGESNRGDTQARQVSLVWLVFLVMMVAGLAWPLQRCVLVVLG